MSFNLGLHGQFISHPYIPLEFWFVCKIGGFMLSIYYDYDVALCLSWGILFLLSPPHGQRSMLERSRACWTLQSEYLLSSWVKLVKPPSYADC